MSSMIFTCTQWNVSCRFQTTRDPVWAISYMDFVNVYTQGHSLPYKELRHTVSGFFNFLYEETNRRQRSSSLIVCFCFIDIMYPINWERAGTYIFINYIAWGMRDCLQLSCKAPRVVLSTRWIGVSVRRYLFSPLLETLSLLTNGVNQINSGDITGFRDSPTIIDYDSR